MPSTEHIVALAILGAGGLLLIFKGEMAAGVGILTAMAGYAFGYTYAVTKNGGKTNGK